MREFPFVFLVFGKSAAVRVSIPATHFYKLRVHEGLVVNRRLFVHFQRGLL